MKKTISALLLFFVSLILFQCGISDPSTKGNGTQVGNAIAGKLVYEDGKPAAGAKIYLRPAGTLADTTGFGLAKVAAVDTFTTTTDDTGAYAIDTGVLDPGTYVIEGDDGEGNLVLIDSVVVEEDSTVEVPEDTLKAAGAIKGVIRLSEGGDPRKVFVLVFGIDRFARVEADGSFKFEDLAESQYDLRILSTIDDYGVLDTLGVAVVSADTTDLDTLELPFEGIPTVKNLKLDYDTLLQIVTLTWDAADPSLVAGYDVYRQHVDSGLVKINSAPVTDTTYSDSTALQDETYSYQVRALDSEGNEGEFLLADTVMVVSAFSFIKDFGEAGDGIGQLSGPSDLAFGSNENLWVIDKNRSKVMQFDSSGTFISEWGEAGTDSNQLNDIYGIDVDEQSNIIVSEWQGTRIQKFDSEGNLIFSFDSAGVQIHDVSVDENGSIYFSLNKLEDGTKHIFKIDSNGEILSSWPLNSVYLQFAILVRNGFVYCAGANPAPGQPFDETVIEVFDTTGTELEPIIVSQSNETSLISIRDIDVDNSGNIYIVDPEGGTVRVFDDTRAFITAFGKKGNSVGEFSWIQGISISQNGKIAISDRTYIHLLQLP